MAPPGTYQVRLTAQESKPDAKGQSETLERWVEFLQKGTVKGREVVSIVPQAEMKNVVKDAPPAPGGAPKVQTLRGNEYVRVWFNKGGNHYLIYFPTGGSASFWSTPAPSLRVTCGSSASPETRG